MGPSSAGPQARWISPQSS